MRNDTSLVCAAQLPLWTACNEMQWAADRHGWHDRGHLGTRYKILECCPKIRLEYRGPRVNLLPSMAISNMVKEISIIDAITQPWPLGPADGMRISLPGLSDKRRLMAPNIPLLLAFKQLPVCILL